MWKLVYNTILMLLLQRKGSSAWNDFAESPNPEMDEVIWI